MKRCTLAAFLVFAVLGGAGCGGLVRASRPFDMTVDWNEFDQIVVNSRNGRIELATSDVTAIHLTGIKHVRGQTLEEAEQRLDQVEIVAEPRGSDSKVFTVEVRYPDALRQSSPGADIKILVPRACRAEIKTSNGGIQVKGMRDEVTLSSSNGGVSAEDITGRVHARTSNGAISIRGVQGNVKADTSNGAISVRGVTGKCDLETSNGSIAAFEVRGDLTVVSSNGGIQVDAIPPDDGSVVLTTSNSSIEAVVPAGMKAEVSLRTSNGRVRSAISNALLTVQEQSKSRLRGLMNGGGAGRIVANSSNGSVSLSCR